MSTTLNLPILSSTAGTSGDGVIFGSVAENTNYFIAAKRIDATTVNVFRRDATPTGFNFVNLSTPGSDGVIDDTPIFGGSGDMTALDTVFVSDSDQATGIHVYVTTPGVWTGTGLKLYDSADGITAGRELTGVVDPSNGFRNAAGWYEITWSAPATPSQAFSPVPGDIPSKKYVMIALDGFTSATTAPVIGRMVVSLSTDGQKYLDITSLASGSTAVPFSVPDYFPSVGSETLLHFASPTYGGERYMFVSRTAGIETVVWEYLNSSNVWTTLPDLYDPSNNATEPIVGSPTHFPVRWSIPADWTAMPNSIQMTTDTTHSATAYWLRIRVTAVAGSGGFITSSAQRFRARSFGPANTTGIVSPTARTLSYLNIVDIGGLSGNTTVAQITNMDTGQAAPFTIPASPTLPLNIDINNVSLAAGESFALQHVSGAGNITGIQMIID